MDIFGARVCVVYSIRHMRHEREFFFNYFSGGGVVGLRRGVRFVETIRLY
jgi:hypothetical protein